MADERLKKRCWFDLEIAKNVFFRKSEYYSMMDDSLGKLWKISGCLTIGGIVIELLKKRHLLTFIPCLKSVTPFFVIACTMAFTLHFPFGGKTYARAASNSEKAYMRYSETQRKLKDVVSLEEDEVIDGASIISQATRWGQLHEALNNDDVWSACNAPIISRRERNNAIYRIMCKHLDSPPSLTLYEYVFGKDDWQAEKQALFNKSIYTMTNE